MTPHMEETKIQPTSGYFNSSYKKDEEPLIRVRNEKRSGFGDFYGNTKTFDRPDKDYDDSQQPRSQSNITA